MKRVLRRTHATSLSDDELTLLDVIFPNENVARGLLLQKGFYPQWLRRHALEDDELDEALTRFAKAGILTTTRWPNDGHRLQGQTCFTMTPEGGRIWESERLPDWSRYTTEMYSRVPIEKESVTIVSTSPSICDDFWRIGWETGFFDCGWFEARPGRSRRATIRDYGLLPWKRFDRLHVLVGIVEASPIQSGCEVTIEENQRQQAERIGMAEELDRRRTWWRFVEELSKFWPSTD